MIKSKLSLLALVTLATAALSTGANAAGYSAGDLILGFKATSGTGSGTNVMIDLGAATTYRDLGANNSLNITNIATILNNTYGLGGGNTVAWYENTALQYALIANNNNSVSGSAVNGDPIKTIYASGARTSAGTLGTASGSAPTISGSTARQNTANAATSFGFTLSSNSTVTSYATSTFNGWSVQVPSSVPFFSSINTAFQQAFTTGTLYSSFGPVNNVEGALDLYRILNSTTGASTNGFGTTNVVGTATFAATIVIGQDGNVSAVNVAAVPEPSGYALLAVAGVMGFFVLRRRSVKA